MKGEADLENDLDRWLYVLKNMSAIHKLPVFTRRPVFEKLFQLAQYSKLSREEQEMYNRSLRNKWDEYSIRQTRIIEMEEAQEKGLQQGLLEGRQKGEYTKAIAIARELKKEGLSIEFIAKTTKLSKEEIEKL